jgi:hypothetical protein
MDGEEDESGSEDDSEKESEGSDSESGSEEESSSIPKFNKKFVGTQLTINKKNPRNIKYNGSGW